MSSDVDWQQKLIGDLGFFELQLGWQQEDFWVFFMPSTSAITTHPIPGTSWLTSWTRIASSTWCGTLLSQCRKEWLLSLATFASVFGSYVISNRTREAIVAFEVMENYDCVRDVIALNSLLSAICRNGRTIDACDYLQIAKNFVWSDVDSYTILMEGWEGEGDNGVVGAKETFVEMVIEIGWDLANVLAYDSPVIQIWTKQQQIMEKQAHMQMNRKRTLKMRLFLILSGDGSRCTPPWWDSQPLMRHVCRLI